MNDKTVFTKDMILFQSTIVKFRNGTVGIAISNKTDENDHDGDEVFVVYDPDNKMFVCQKRLCCYDDNLRNTLSLKGIMNKVNAAAVGDKDAYASVKLEDNAWDVVGVNVYPYISDAFLLITNPQGIPFWRYKINR